MGTVPSPAKRFYWAFAFATLFLLHPGLGICANKVAIVIGNADYTSNALPNPVNDATLISDRLRQLRFDVQLVVNATQLEMLEAIGEFESQLRTDSETVAFAYYAGHGVQVAGENYLLPIDFNGNSEGDARRRGVNANELLQAMERAGSKVNFLVLDACRDNPFENQWRSLSGGLAQIKAPAGTLVAYATAPGQVALDGTGEHSPYTNALSLALLETGLPAEMVFKRARGLVIEQTRGAQVPWDNSSLHGEDFYFTSPLPATEPQIGTATANNSEALFWKGISDSQRPQDYETYLAQYPNGLFTTLAQSRLQTLSQKQNSSDELQLAAAANSTSKNRSNQAHPSTTKNGNSTPTPDTKRQTPRSGPKTVVFMLEGDPAIGLGMQTHLAVALQRAGFRVIKSNELSRGTRSTRAVTDRFEQVLDELSKESDILVVLSTQSLGEQVLKFYGRSATLNTVLSNITAYQLYGNRNVQHLPPVEMKFTDINMVKKIQDAANQLSSELINSLATL